MYGYVVVNKPELKFREYDVYRSYYCGLCRSLGDWYGLGGKLSISYDMTFLVLLLTGLYEPKVTCVSKRCVVHPAAKHLERRSNITDYVAHMNILMAYYKCMDDWKDERKFTRKAYAWQLTGKVKKIEKQYPQKAGYIKAQLEQLSDCEKRQEANIDTAAKYFGNLMAELTVMKQDEWECTLRDLGFGLGKFIYLLDAYEDLEEDLKRGRYNVFKPHMESADFDALVEGILNVVMAQCAQNFERLPIIQDAELLRNIIYSGVWTRFEAAREKKKRRRQEKNPVQ